MSDDRLDALRIPTLLAIDLSAPTGYFEVSVWHFSDGSYSVDTDRGLGRLTVYETDSKDKALGAAEYIESVRRYYSSDSGGIVTNEGTPFDGSIVHWDCKHEERAR